jgi:tetratricopeptide (TPR) repeat protein
MKKSILSAGISFLAVVVGWPVGIVAAEPVGAAGAASVAAARKADLNASLAAFSNGNYGLAESSLKASLLSAPGTAGYQYELGARLGTAALLLYDRHAYAAAQAAARQALSHLDITQAPLSSASAVVCGGAEELAGCLEERVLADLGAAQQCYRRAVQLDPKRKISELGLGRVTNLLQVRGEAK